MNVNDYYKDWEVDAIRADLDTNRSPLISVFINLSGDFNKATGIRNHNHFCGREIWLVGNKQYDRRGTVGTHHYENIHHAEFFADVVLANPGYKIVAVENNITLDKPTYSVVDYEFPEKTMLVFGEEKSGIPEVILELCHDLVYIPNRGSVRSLNVGTASGIMMYEYSKQRGLI